MYLNHITISTGHFYRAERRAADDYRLGIVAAWLAAALEAGGEPVPIPNLWSLRDPYDGAAVTGYGGLMVTLFPGAERRPLVTFGVAKKSRGSGSLWRMLIDAAAKAAPAPERLLSVAPSTPWCAVIVWPTSPPHPQLIAAAGEFEQLAAWAWIERKNSVP